MKRIRIVGLCLTAIFVLGAAVSASASAHEYTIKEGTLPQAIRGGSSTVSKLESTVAGAKITIECSKNTISSGEFLNVDESKGEITFEGCKIKEVAACEVPNIKFKVKDILFGEAGMPVKDRFLPTGANEEFVSIKINTCALKGTYPVKGKQVCELPNGEVFNLKHTIECRPSGSELTFGPEPAKYTGNEEVELVSEKEFKAT